MTLSGQGQAELIKAALVVATAGVIVYYGKKFVDGFTSKVGSIADAPAKAITAIGGAIGSASASVIDASKSGIEKAAAASANRDNVLSGVRKTTLGALVYPDTYNVPFDSGSGQGW